MTYGDELPFTFEEMYGFSTVDGFVEITESLAEMIKYLANEPSTGLFYIQQHTQNAVPNVVSLRNNALEQSREIMLHTEDSEDSITTLRSMKECGFPITDEMIRDIKKSLFLMSTKQPRRGLIQNHSSGVLPTARISSWRSGSWGRGAILGPSLASSSAATSASASGYISTVFKSAREKATNFKWPQLDVKDLADPNNVLPSVAGSGSNPWPHDMEAETEELPLSSQVNEELQQEEGEESHIDGKVGTNLLPVSDNFDNFKADKEAKLEEWLEEAGRFSNPRALSDGEGH